MNIEFNLSSVPATTEEIERWRSQAHCDRERLRIHEKAVVIGYALAAVLECVVVGLAVWSGRFEIEWAAAGAAGLILVAMLVTASAVAEEGEISSDWSVTRATELLWASTIGLFGISDWLALIVMAVLIIAFFSMWMFREQTLRRAAQIDALLVELDVESHPDEYIALQRWSTTNPKVNAYLNAIALMGRMPVAGEFKAAKTMMSEALPRPVKDELIEQARKAHANLGFSR